ncbi:hypothetical protein PG988_010917 [Apiospora saccharicola]
MDLPHGYTGIWQPGRQPTDREWDGFLDKKHTKQTPNSAKLHFTLVSSTGDGICVLFAYANTVYGLKQAAGLQQTEVVFVTGVGSKFRTLKRMHSV